MYIRTWQEVYPTGGSFEHVSRIIEGVARENEADDHENEGDDGENGLSTVVIWKVEIKIKRTESFARGFLLLT